MIRSCLMSHGVWSTNRKEVDGKRWKVGGLDSILDIVAPKGHKQ
jgi:hypothetical protein